MMLRMAEVLQPITKEDIRDLPILRATRANSRFWLGG
jgi:hypothetical protein